MEAHTCHRKGNPILTGRRFRDVSSPSKSKCKFVGYVALNLKTNTLIVFNLIAANQYVEKPRECERKRDILKGMFSQICYTCLGPSIHRLVTDIQVNVKYWEYVFEAELSKTVC